MTGVAEEGFEELYDEAPCGYLSTGADGTISRVNATFLRWTGFSSSDLVGVRRFSELLTGGGRIYYETHIAPLLVMQGFLREVAVEVRRADGSVLPALINCNVKRDPHDSIMSVRVIVLDATERRGYEQELLRERQRAQQAEEKALDLAETLQESLIPPSPSQIPGVEVAAFYRPAGEGGAVGGDFYDVFETPRGDWMALVGDVSGKGIQAARVMAAARYTLRAAAMRSSRPEVVLTEVNAALLAQGLERFCTVCLASIAARDRSLHVTVGAAGHPLPVKVSPDGSVIAVGAPGTFLGAFEEVVIEPVVTSLSSGEALVLYTDGVTEARAPDGRFFGQDELHRVVREAASSGARGLCDAISDAVLDFQANAPRDDVIVLALRVIDR